MPPSIIAAGKNDWQYPARTEEWVWVALQELAIDTPFFQFVSFPWATLIDLQRRELTDRAQALRREIVELGPKTTLVRATICQHIWMKDLIPVFVKLGITDLFWPHATHGETEIDGIRIHPFPLFPVRGFEGLELRRDIPTSQTRDLLFNFAGAYDPQGYLTPVREWIFDLPPSPGYTIQKRANWHYESDVYLRQILRKPVEQNADRDQGNHALEYDAMLSRSLFTLCPSGSGPNSIRFWEAIMFGSIPVLLSDRLRLPGSDRDWHDGIVRIPETEIAVAELPGRLAKVAQDEEKVAQLQAHLKMLASIYILDAARTLVLPISEMDYIRKVTQA